MVINKMCIRKIELVKKMQLKTLQNRDKLWWRVVVGDGDG